MRKKGNWLSLLKGVFISRYREKPLGRVNVLNTKPEQAPKERKRWGIGRLRHNGPSSIEKILQEAEREGRGDPATGTTANVEEEHYSVLPPPRPNSLHHRVAADQQLPPHPNSYHRVAEKDQQQGLGNSQPKAPHEYGLCATQQNSYTKSGEHSSQHAAATKIQTTFRGYLARRSFRAIKGLLRLQSMLRSQNVQRQTMNTMRCMQQLVRVQTEINARRLQVLESQNLLWRQSLQKNDAEIEMSGSNLQGDWDDSVLTKEETDARLQRKAEATIQRERALAYIYSHQVRKGMSKSAQALIMELRSAKLPWHWNWFERQAMAQVPDRCQATTCNPKLSIIEIRPATCSSKRMPSLDVPAPRPSMSPLAIKSTRSPKSASIDGSPWYRHHKVVATTTLRDDESLTSCPPFASPNYMVPTISAKAKVRSQVKSTDKSKVRGLEPTKRRLMLTSARSPFSSLSWGKRSLFTSKEADPQRPFGSCKDMHSPGTLSVDSTTSLPVGVGRRPFR